MERLITFWRAAYLAYFSHPAKDRVLYQAVRRGKPARILQFGIERAKRSIRLIALAQKQRPGEIVHFTGIDLFELAKGESPALPLKAAHCTLRATGARVRLVPGDALTALAREANEIGSCDLIVIAASQRGEPLTSAWFYVPRLLHPTTLVFLEQPVGEHGSSEFRLLDHGEIRRLAQAATRRTAA